uniref:Uncharacterized protein n=1 Tax=Acrobeloides nanus TaxID=290746 RepID=A0A914E1S8_9BILA
MKFLLILTIVCLVIQLYANDMNQHVNETDAEDSISQKRSPLGDVENHCVGPDCSNNQNKTQREKRSPLRIGEGPICDCVCVTAPCPCRCW